MKIETKLTLKNMIRNIKRTIYTTISIALCTFLILTTLLLIASIRNGINENTNIEYNDYHFIIKGVNSDEFNLIKDKSYIDKIYIQSNDNEGLRELNEIDDPFSNIDTINVYIKYKNVKETYKYSSNIIQTLQYSLTDAETKCQFNDKMLTVYGLMGANLDFSDSLQLVYKSQVNFSYVIDLMIVLILIVFSVLFIIILYNAFLVTINERKREYAILNSIGGTEGQILKMIFIEATIMGIFGIVIGGIISFLATNGILRVINDILDPTTFNFSLVVDIKYVITALIIILFNIYISAIIPSVKASSTSVIESIRNNKQIKYRKRNYIIGKILPVEGRIAFVNIKRNKNKYRVITTLMVICMVSFISVSTYINYEKESANLVTDYDIDAELIIDASKIDYKKMFEDYSATTGDTIEYFEYKDDGFYALVDPPSAIETDVGTFDYENDENGMNIELLGLEGKEYNENDKKGIIIEIVGLEDKKYNEYINKINANYGDYIIYNTVVESEKVGENEYIYTYSSAFNTNNINIYLLNEKLKEGDLENTQTYEIVDIGELNGNFVLTDEILDGFKDRARDCSIFVNMETYNKLEEKIPKDTSEVTGRISVERIMEDRRVIRVNCGNIISFSDYSWNLARKDDLKYLIPLIYSLEYQEKMIYLDILQLILRIIILTIVVIGIVSAINIINASLLERREEFNILSRLGATNGNMNKILIYECIYMFIKALIISVILSIPIIYGIVKHMENVIILKKLLIPFGSVSVFFAILFIISLVITLFSARFIKNK